MKIFYITIILIFIVNQVLYCQVKVSEEVKELYEIADNLIQRKMNTDNLKENFSKDKAIELARKISNAIINDPVGFNIYLSEEYKKWKKETEENNYDPISVKPAYKLHLLKEIVSYFLGEEFTGIITTPIFLRVKIIDIETGFYATEVTKIKTTQTNLSVIIEDVLKGGNNFNIGDTLNVSYLNWWMNSCKIKFVKGKNYLLPIKLTDCSKELGCQSYTLRIFDFDCPGIKEIENETVKDSENVLDNLSSLWAQFKIEFKNKYITF